MYYSHRFLGEAESLEEPFRTREITPRKRKSIEEFVSHLPITMDVIHMLVVGRNKHMLNTVAKIINGHADWHGTGVCSDAEDIQLLNQNVYDLLLLNNRINDASKQALRDHLKNVQPSQKLYNIMVEEAACYVAKLSMH